MSDNRAAALIAWLADRPELAARVAARLVERLAEDDASLGAFLELAGADARETLRVALAEREVGDVEAPR